MRMRRTLAHMDPDAANLPEHVRDLFRSDVRTIRTSGGLELTKLGSDGGGTFVVDHHGEVTWLAAEPGHRSRFVNSSARLFGEFLSKVGPLRDRIAGMADDDALREVVSMRNDLRVEDPAAFGAGDAWWSIVFEQIEDGML
jgi:hypothetical protein